MRLAIKQGGRTPREGSASASEKPTLHDRSSHTFPEAHPTDRTRIWKRVTSFNVLEAC